MTALRFSLPQTFEQSSADSVASLQQQEGLSEPELFVLTDAQVQTPPVCLQQEVQGGAQSQRGDHLRGRGQLHADATQTPQETAAQDAAQQVRNAVQAHPPPADPAPSLLTPPPRLC